MHAPLDWNVSGTEWISGWPPMEQVIAIADPQIPGLYQYQLVYRAERIHSQLFD